MRYVLAIMALVALGCGSQATQASQRTLPELRFSEMPEEVERPAGGVQTVAVDQCLVGEGEDAQETGPGILFSTETATYVGRLRVAYDEVRGLYLVDQRTWARMREVYQHHLDLSDDEIRRANERAERSWIEQHDGLLGLFGGVLLGAALAVGIAAAFDGVIGGI